jgi:hypothetical protein
MGINICETYWCDSYDPLNLPDPIPCKHRQWHHLSIPLGADGPKDFKGNVHATCNLDSGMCYYSHSYKWPMNNFYPICHNGKYEPIEIKGK